MKEYEVKIILDYTKDNNLIISTIKDLINKKIFDLSRISYLALIFLDPYITPYLKNVLDYDIDIQDRLCESQELIFDYLPPLNNTITNILSVMIELLVFIELQLNIHLFIFHLHFTDKKYLNQQNLNPENRSNVSEIVKIFNILSISKSNKIKPSTLMLLVFKIINKVGNIPSILLNFIRNSKIEDLKHLEKKIKDYSSNISKSSDDFIISFFTDDDNSNISNNALTICKDYILNIARTNLEMFATIFDILINYIIKENPNQNEKMIFIKNSIINLIDLEITLFESKL